MQPFAPSAQPFSRQQAVGSARLSGNGPKENAPKRNFGSLLLFHRTGAAIEVVMFVIARRMVATDVSSLELLLGTAALAGLLVVRFYFLPGRPK